MNRILPHSLWIGHAGDGQNHQEILDAGIKALVQLAVEEPPINPPRELISCRFPLIDGTGNDSALISVTVQTLVQLLNDGLPTLVFCGGGLSRSPAIAAAALTFLTGHSPEKCLDQIALHHHCDVSPGLWNDVNAALPSGP